MSVISQELEKLKALEASGKKKTWMEGAISALEWALEDTRTSPSLTAASFQSDPLDHDGDGKKGGSLAGKKATARKK
jgi:hypothetical protein